LDYWRSWLQYKKTLIHLLDRPGGRFLLGKIATFVVRHNGSGVQLSYLNGFWTRHIGNQFFPDGPRFEYEYSDFCWWEHQMDHHSADTNDYWLQHYAPRDGDIIIDVGAGHGEDVAEFSRRVGKTGRVIAIEAHPISYAILKRFCELNGLRNVTALNIALMDAAGLVQMDETGVSWQVNSVVRKESNASGAVRAATLVDIFKEHKIEKIAFLKMNIEGAEREALQGMDAIMPRIEQICVACHDFWSEKGHGEKFRTRVFVEHFLAKHGFTIESRPGDPRDYVRDHVFGLRPK
jgi:FkbM family methyltransferase